MLFLKDFYQKWNPKREGSMYETEKHPKPEFLEIEIDFQRTCTIKFWVFHG